MSNCNCENCRKRREGWAADLPAPEPLTDEQIELVAENFDAIDAKDSFWKEFARAIEAEVRALGKPA